MRKNKAARGSCSYQRAKGTRPYRVTSRDIITPEMESAYNRAGIIVGAMFGLCCIFEAVL